MWKAGIVFSVYHLLISRILILLLSLRLHLHTVDLPLRDGNQGDGSGDHLVWGICKKGTCHTIGEQYHLASLSNHSWKKWS